MYINACAWRRVHRGHEAQHQMLVSRQGRRTRLLSPSRVAKKMPKQAPTRVCSRRPSPPSSAAKPKQTAAWTLELPQASAAFQTGQLHQTRRVRQGSKPSCIASEDQRRQLDRLRLCWTQAIAATTATTPAQGGPPCLRSQTTRPVVAAAVRKIRGWACHERWRTRTLRRRKLARSGATVRACRTTRHRNGHRSSLGSCLRPP
jgi:hypothetical protein